MTDGGAGYSESQNPAPAYSSSEGDGYAPSQPQDAPYGPSLEGGYSSAGAQQPDSPKPVSRLFANGVNMQPSYKDNGDVDLGWELLKPIATIGTVRLEIEDFAVDAAARWIYEANSRGYKVIATYHNADAIDDKPASDDPKHMQQAIQFWNANFKKLWAAGPFTINIMNEWGHKTIDAKTYADHYNAAINAIRGYYSGALIIDLPGSGQLAKVAADAVTGAGGITPIHDSNIILSVHVYPKTWNGKGPMTTADLDKLVSTGRPCMIGEFGDSGETADTDWAGIVNYAKSLGWPVLAWCWDGDGTVMNIMLPEFQSYVPGKPQPYHINSQYADVVLPLLR